MAIPADFALHTRISPATRAWEPMYSSTATGVFRIGIVITEAHCNTRGFLHGGVVATLADNACGLTLAQTLGGNAAGIVTTSLSVDYIAPAKLGQWLEVMPRVVKAGKSSGVIDALLLADGVTIARANASFRVLA